MKSTLRHLGYAVVALPLSFAPASRQRLATRLGIEQRRGVPVPLVPALVGAWFVHAPVALAMQVVCMAAIRRLNSYRGRVPAEAI